MLITQRVLQLRSTGVLAYDEFVDKPRKKERQLSNFKINDHTQALRRFNKYISHFSMMFKACKDLDFSSLRYFEKGKPYLWNPTMITFTVPIQNVSDHKFKRDVLNRLLLVFKRKFNVKTYIWKAEAQHRGAIHFHFVVDKFIPNAAMRHYWYKMLKDYNCIGKDNAGIYIPEIVHSRIVHCKKVKNFDSMEQELSSYFDLKHNEDGSLQHKHDRSKSVREIEGKFYGCSDNLRYNYLSILDSRKYETELNKAVRKDIQITHSTGISIFQYITTHYSEQACKWVRNIIHNKFFTINNFYHFTFFSYIYLAKDITDKFNTLCKEMNLTFFMPDFYFLQSGEL